MDDETRGLPPDAPATRGELPPSRSWHTDLVDSPEKDGASVRIPPPLVFLVLVIAGVLLHRYAMPLSTGMGQGARTGLAVIPGVLGLLLMGAAFVHFRRTGQDPKPWEPTPEIISGGIYRLSRNPMYLGMALVQAALGIGLDNWWMVILIPVSLAIVYVTAVRPEEAYLERKFGEQYTRYKGTVRRWI